jgi:hypothetical protein
VPFWSKDNRFSLSPRKSSLFDSVFPLHNCYLDTAKLRLSAMRIISRRAEEEQPEEEEWMLKKKRKWEEEEEEPEEEEEELWEEEW